MDDFVLFAATREALRTALAAIHRLLDGLRLALHPGKSRLLRTRDGVTFLGWRVFPHHSRLVRGNIVRFVQTLRELEAAHRLRRVSGQAVQQRFQTWLAHAAHGNTWKLREGLLAKATFGGRAV